MSHEHYIKIQKQNLNKIKSIQKNINERKLNLNTIF